MLNLSTFGRTSTPFNINNSNISAVIAVAVISLIVAIVLYALVVQMKNRPQNAVLNWLREYLNFRDILLDALLKFGYLFFMLFFTLYAIVIMVMGDPLTGLLILLGGNIALRLVFEIIMLLIGIWKNLTDIQNSAADLKERFCVTPPASQPKPAPESKSPSSKPSSRDIIKE